MPANISDVKEFMLSENLPEISNYEVIKSEPIDRTAMNPTPPQLYQYPYSVSSGVPVGHVQPQINGCLPGPAGQRRTVQGNLRKQQRSAPYTPHVNDEKLNIRRKRNREAAQRCRQRRLDLIDTLTEQVRDLDREKQRLLIDLRKEQEDKRELISVLENHARDCDRGIGEKLRQLVEDSLPVMAEGEGSLDFPDDQTVPYPRSLLSNNSAQSPPLGLVVGPPRSPPMFRSEPPCSSEMMIDEGYLSSTPAVMNGVDSSSIDRNMHIKSEIVSANNIPFKLDNCAVSNSHSNVGYSTSQDNGYGQLSGFDNNSFRGLFSTTSGINGATSSHIPTGTTSFSAMPSSGSTLYYGVSVPAISNHDQHFINRPSSLEFSSGPMGLGGVPLETPSSTVFCYDPKVQALLEQSTGLTPVTNTGLTPLLACPSVTQMGSATLETPSISTTSLTSL